MNAIPWYRSPVIVSAVAGLISQLLVLLGIGDAVSEGDLAKWIDGVFQLIALGAGTWTVIARSRSKVQPVTLTKDSAEDKNQARTPAWISLVSLLMALMFLSACGTLLVGRAQTLEQRAAAALGDFELYQRASLKIGTDQTVPVEVRREVLQLQIAAKPTADKLDEGLRDYRSILAQLQAGATRDEKLAIAAANLQSWIQKLAPLVRSLRTKVEEVQK